MTALAQLLPLLPAEKRSSLRQMLAAMPPVELASALQRLRDKLAVSGRSSNDVSEPEPDSTIAKVRRAVPKPPSLSQQGHQQLRMLLGFYEVNDPSKSGAAVQQIMDRRRGQQTELPMPAFEELCAKLRQKYGDDPAAYDDDDL